MNFFFSHKLYFTSTKILKFFFFLFLLREFIGTRPSCWMNKTYLKKLCVSRERKGNRSLTVNQREWERVSTNAISRENTRMVRGKKERMNICFYKIVCCNIAMWEHCRYKRRAREVREKRHALYRKKVELNFNKMEKVIFVVGRLHLSH